MSFPKSAMCDIRVLQTAPETDVQLVPGIFLVELET